MADVVIYNELKQVLVLNKRSLIQSKAPYTNDWFKKIEGQSAIEETDAEFLQISREYNFI